MEKRYVRELFNSIAHRYDVLNHVLSAGIDFAWRKKAIDRLRPEHPATILDVATGTGDFAIAAARLKPARVVGVDIAENMLELGRTKIRRKQLDGIVSLENGEAENLAFPSDVFDAAIVAFGARNFEDLHRGLTEMRRVLRPGGTILVLEFSRPRAFPFKQLYFFYFRKVLPWIGKVVSRSTHAYTYLPDSVMKFPDGEHFLETLQKVGFTDARQEPLTMGIATIYTGKK